MKNVNKAKVVFTSAKSLAWFIVSTFLIILLIVLTVLEYGMLGPILGTVLGGAKPIYGENNLNIYKSEYATKEASTQAGNELNVEIAEEGFVLLLNEETDGKTALPIETSNNKKAKVSVFGHNSVDIVLGGSGSGGISGVEATTIYDSLKNNNFEYNPELKAFYESSAAGSKRTSTVLTDATSSSPTLDIGETPVANYTSKVKSSFKDYNDAAIVVISRVGGESFDVPRTQSSRGGIEGNHYLQLDQNEYDMLDMVTARFDKVIVLLNTLQAFQCDFIAEYNNTPDDPRIDAVMWIGGPGATGAEAVGELLSGQVNPSGKTVDIYPADFTKDPVWINFGDNSQSSADGKSNTAYAEGGKDVSGYNMVMYEEGVYLGYRYYETRGKVEADNGNSEWYDENVIFPFGYGLSYTNFEQTIKSVTGSLDNKGTVTITVESKNVGNVAGRDTIELYVSKPYIDGQIEKSHVELIDFAKTEVLEPGATSKTYTFTVNAYDLASYDSYDLNDNGFKGYETEKGAYTFYLSKNSHVEGVDNVYDSREVSVTESMTFETSAETQDGYKVENRYTTDETDYYAIDYRLTTTYVNGEERKGMSRMDFSKVDSTMNTGTFPTALTAEERTFRSAQDKNGLTEKQALQSLAHNNTEVANVTMPTTGKSSTITLRNLLGEKDLDNNNERTAADGYQLVSYDDAKWDELLDSLTFDEMVDLVNNGAFQTAAIAHIGKNLTLDSDGPIGFVNFMPGKSESFKGNTTFACEIVIGSTWNKDLAYRVGKIVGENGLWGDVNGTMLPYTGWYAPAINLHRSPFSGRNFEYYSEDPILTGKLAINTINGCKTKGVYTDLKHFAVNDQETNRSGVSTFMTEQTLRELYLKPFEMAVKGSDDPSQVATAVKDGWTKYEGTTGIMTSFNRIGNKWTGGDYRLLTDILRGEWGFKGLAICDYKTDNFFMDAKQMVYAGNDLILASLTNLMWTSGCKSGAPNASSAEDVYVLRKAAKNILYTVANSNAIQQDIEGYKTEWWKSLTIALDVIIPVGLAVWGFFAVTGVIKKAEAKAASSDGAEQTE